MADVKLSALTELAATPAVNDELYIRDVSEAATNESKRITMSYINPTVARCIVASRDCNGADDDVQIQAAIDGLS